jgi:hypothetical protein
LRWFSHANSLRGWSGSSKKNAQIGNRLLGCPSAACASKHIIVLYYISIHPIHGLINPSSS